MKYQIEKPADKDLFDSSGHSNAANAIKDVILNQSDIHAIGLEGELGSGKSTVLRLLEQDLPKEEYKFITFDVEQFHHSATKASFIKHLRDRLIQHFGNVDSAKAEQFRENVSIAADRALGNELTYTKKVKSTLSWYTVSFAISLMLSVRYIKESLENVYSTVAFFLSETGQYNFGINETITTVLGLSPLLVAAHLISKGRKEKHLPKEERHTPNIGDIFKRNSEDTITEKLQVTREVGSSELKQAFNKMISSIPEGQRVILVVDNLDRVDKEKVREVWSDLEIFTSCAGESLRIIVPFSEKHVAAALSDEDNNDGSEFILKRLPVKFRTPPIVSAGWRQPFAYYWHETLPENEGLELCAELIDIWVAPYKQITPRFLKTHINELAVTLASNPAEISAVSCCAYLLAQRSKDLTFRNIISTDIDNQKESTKQVVVLTQKVLRKALSEESWASQIMAIHYQTSIHIAKSELLETPLKRAVNHHDFDDVLQLAPLFGFDIAFQRLLGTVDPYEAVELFAGADFKNKEHSQWVGKWLPNVNQYLYQEKNNHLGYNGNLLNSYRVLNEAGFEVSNNRLINEHKALSVHAEQEATDNLDELLPQLYDMESVIGYNFTPRFISKPSVKLFVDILWGHRDDFPQWKFKKNIENLNLKLLFNYILEKDFYLTNNIIDQVSTFYMLGAVNFSGTGKKTLSSIREYGSFEYEEDDYPQILITSDFSTRSVSNSLISNLSSYENSEFLAEWVAITLVSSISSNSLSVGYGEHTQLSYILDNFYDKDTQLPYIKKFLAFGRSIQTILSSAEHPDMPVEIKELIYSYIALDRVTSLNINLIASNHYDDMREYLDESLLIKTLDRLFAWESFVKDDDKDAILSWSSAFLQDALYLNSKWQGFICEWFDSKENNDEFWLKAIKNNSPKLQIIATWYSENNKKLIKSSIVTSCIIENLDTFISETIYAETVQKLIKILPQNSSGKIERKASLMLINEQYPVTNKLLLIGSFTRYLLLPSFSGDASKWVVIELIENANSQVVVDWLRNQIDTLTSTKWGTYSTNLSQALENISENFDIGELEQFILKEPEGESIDEEPEKYEAMSH